MSYKKKIGMSILPIKVSHSLTTKYPRTTTLSFATGAAALGSIPAYTLGGMLTQYSQNVLFVYLIALTVHALMAFFTWIFLPESFTLEIRNKLKKERESPWSLCLYPRAIHRLSGFSAGC